MKRTNRLLLFLISVVLCLILLGVSVAGLSAPAEGLLALPLQAVQGVMNGLVVRSGNLAQELFTLQQLQARNRDLEAALAAFQSEVVELREVRHDYDRIAALLEYTRARQNEEYVVADVIGRDISAFTRVIYLNRGARDGLTEGMPVVTENGLVGRVAQVSANAAEVLLITDPISAVNARLLNSRDEGSVQGQSTGLRMTYIDLNAELQEGDTVITSGLGGNFPEGIIIGQVTSIRQFEFELFQETEVRSLNDFERLETVLVITNFQPVDLSVFDEPAEGS
ncbi:MAG: rod shape-determining protein MreC [Anaerolineae bacterium]|nr:rod shape-determining protein MreC [Anaerolineae bacterium]